MSCFLQLLLSLWVTSSRHLGSVRRSGQEGTRSTLPPAPSATHLCEVYSSSKKAKYVHSMNVNTDKILATILVAVQYHEQSVKNCALCMYIRGCVNCILSVKVVTVTWKCNNEQCPRSKSKALSSQLVACL